MGFYFILKIINGGDKMFEYKNLKINYIQYGNKEGIPIVLLHGWGQNIDMMKMIGDKFTKNNIIIIDLPGHGQSEEPKEIWYLNDFVDMVHELLKHLNVENPVLIGHSFGGKISLLYASKYPTRKLVTLAGPFRVAKPSNSLKYKILKTAKNLPGMGKVAEFAKKHMGSTDYRKASPIMREIMVKHINTDITEDVKKITCPTIIIWGDRDAAVPVEDAYVLEDLIKDSAAIIYEGCTHYAYLEQLGKTVSIIKNLIKENDNE